MIGTPNPVNGQHLHDEAVRAVVGRARGARRADRLPPDRQHLAEGRCRAALCRPRQFPPDRARDPQPRRADGRDRQPDHRRRHGAPSEAARRLSRRHGRLAATGGCGGSTTSGRSSGPAARSRYRCCRASTSSGNAISRSMSTRSRRCTRSTRWAPIISSCRATTRIPTARSPRRSGNSSACRSMTSSAARSCGTIARGSTRSRPRPAR